ncbi:MAG: type III secretion system outer membrane ring subunit SctC [Victivallales bacterium]|nr:type III secretion system outer membrane ring subunit SctC [Victivallales bacterium]
MKYSWQILLAFWLFLAAFAQAEEPNAPEAAGEGLPWKTETYTLLAREMPLREVLSTFGTAQGISVVMSDWVAGQVSGDFRDLPPQEFLDRITTLYNLIWYYDGAILYIYSDSEITTMLLDLQYMKAAEVRSMLCDLGMEDERFPIKTTSDDELLMVAGPPRYVQVVAELVAKADRLREKRAYSEVETRIFRLKHTWADDVSLSASGSESTVQIKGVAKMLEEVMAVSSVVRTQEKGMDGDPQDVLSDATDRSFKPVIKAENRLNAVIIRDVVSRMPMYEKIIEQLDVPQKLVEIAVTSLEMSKDDALDWQLSLAVRGTTSNADAGAGQNAGSLFTPAELAGQGLAGALSYIGKHVTVSASLSALRQKGKARSISRTSILTMNNMAASITDMQSYHAKVVGTEVASLEEVSAGTSLQVKPRIVEMPEPGKTCQLWMTVSLEDGGFESISVDSMPLSRTSSVLTQAAVFEGECILLGGYMRDIEEEVKWGIPLLRDIPWIGWIFGGVSKKTSTIQRMFILTPYIVELDTEDLPRVQATRQRDIHVEETLEDDKLEDDAVRELRTLEREERNLELHEHHADELEQRKAELKLEREMREADRQDAQTEWKEELQERREEWREELRERREAQQGTSSEASAEQEISAEAPASNTDE